MEADDESAGLHGSSSSSDDLSYTAGTTNADNTGSGTTAKVRAAFNDWCSREYSGVDDSDSDTYSPDTLKERVKDPRFRRIRRVNKKFREVVRLRTDISGACLDDLNRLHVMLLAVRRDLVAAEAEIRARLDEADSLHTGDVHLYKHLRREFLSRLVGVQRVGTVARDVWPCGGGGGVDIQRDNSETVFHRVIAHVPSARAKRMQPNAAGAVPARNAQTDVGKDGKISDVSNNVSPWSKSSSERPPEKFDDNVAPAPAPAPKATSSRESASADVKGPSGERDRRSTRTPSSSSGASPDGTMDLMRQSENKKKANDIEGPLTPAETGSEGGGSGGSRESTGEFPKGANGGHISRRERKVTDSTHSTAPYVDAKLPLTPDPSPQKKIARAIVLA
eukprot:Opistho-2@95505